MTGFSFLYSANQVDFDCYPKSSLHEKLILSLSRSISEPHEANQNEIIKSHCVIVSAAIDFKINSSGGLKTCFI